METLLHYGLGAVILVVGIAVLLVWFWIEEYLWNRRPKQTARSVRQANKKAISNLLSSAQSYELNRRRLRGDTIDRMRTVVRDHQSAGRGRRSSRRP
ncbi:hypothetical protein [Streptomyces sp. cg40]|uniref:hypothetical protein n=1 Tax=Streptomyces sp. cg40 TaxID=3419764 RepID=UPI003D0333C9